MIVRMKNVKQAQTYLYRVVLDTVSDVNAFNRAATACKGEVYLVGENMKINAKSLLGVLSLGIIKGAVITLIADGPDEKEAIEALVELISSDFAE
jgi:phosphocarrier protein